jgi:uncharacterized alkaline shock family protein YloU
VSSSTTDQGQAMVHSQREPGSEGGGGETKIEDAVVAKIAAIAAREVDGVSGLGGAVSSALSGVVGRIRGDEHATGGVGVEVGTRQAAVDVSMSVQYPAAIPDVADAVRENIVDRIQSLTGLEVVEVNIVVVDLEFPGEESTEDSRVA